MWSLKKKKKDYFGHIFQREKNAFFKNFKQNKGKNNIALK